MLKFQALLVEPNKEYNVHWPIRRGRLNVHEGPCGTLTSVLSDLELIWGYAIQNMLDIPLKDLKVNLPLFEPLRQKTKFGFPTRSDTNQPVQSQTQARSLRFWILEEEGLYYPCSENKGADQLRGYREAGLRLCFRICRLWVFSCGGSF